MKKFQIVKNKFKGFDSGLSGTVPIILEDLPQELQDKIQAIKPPKSSLILRSGWYENGGIVFNSQGQFSITKVIYVRSVENFLAGSDIYNLTDDIQIGLKVK